MNGEIVRCRSCRAECFWVKTEKGKQMLVDAQSSPRGAFVMLDGHVAHFVRKDETTDQPRWTSHFVTCPSAAQHRRTK